MKLVALVLTLLLVGGVAGGALVSWATGMIKPRFPTNLGVDLAQATPISATATANTPQLVARDTPSGSESAPENPAKASLQTPSVSSQEPPKPPLPAQVASMPDATLKERPPAQEAKAKAAFNSTEKEVRDLSHGRCGGRMMNSIAVLPDGTVQVQC
jgi:hypothetical protein